MSDTSPPPSGLTRIQQVGAAAGSLLLVATGFGLGNATSGAGDASIFADGDLVVWEQDFTAAGSMASVECNLFHRDDVIVTQTSWLGSHVPIDGVDPDAATGPYQNRTIVRGDRADGFDPGWCYRVAPNDNPELAHLMTAVGDTSAYSIGSVTMAPTFEGVTEFRWSQNINVGSKVNAAGEVVPFDGVFPDVDFPRFVPDGFVRGSLTGRNFTEVKIVPVEHFDPQNLPCTFATLPCGTDDSSPSRPIVSAALNDGQLRINVAGVESLASPGGAGAICKVLVNEPACFDESIRLPWVFRDNGDGTLTLRVTGTSGQTWSHTVPGAFPAGEVRVVWADHNYTPTKGYWAGGITTDPRALDWHADNFGVTAATLSDEVTTPDPDPTVEPTDAPTPDPTPTPTGGPSPSPDPSPSPTVAPSPTPDPGPDPTPDPTATPDPDPGSVTLVCDPVCQLVPTP